MSDLPALSRSDVRDWTEQCFYDRGETYFRQGRIQRPRREGRTLKAECQDSQPSPYHVEAELDNEGIAAAGSSGTGPTTPSWRRRRRTNSTSWASGCGQRFRTAPGRRRNERS